MKTGILLVACCVLVSAGSARAQSSGTASDVLSGTWTGQMGPDGGKLIPVTMQLKSDGKGGVSGTITGPPHPGTVKSATFDAKTGALKLDVAVQDEASTAVSFDGTLVDGMATGRVAIGTDSRGVFRLTKGAGATAGTANDAAASVRKNVAEVSGWIASAADAVPADKYSYRPTESVRTFGQLIGHVAVASITPHAETQGLTRRRKDAENSTLESPLRSLRLCVRSPLHSCVRSVAQPGRADDGERFVTCGTSTEGCRSRRRPDRRSSRSGMP